MSFKRLYFFLVLLCISSKSIAQYGPGYQQTGVISYFLDQVADRVTANGEQFDNEDLVAGHPNIPFNSKVRVTNLSNGRSVIVRINDRGPYAYGRIMDISKAAALKIGLTATGVTKAKIEVLSDKPILAEEEPDYDEKDEPEEKSSTNVGSFEAGYTFSQWGTLKSPSGYGVQVGGFGSSDAAIKYSKYLEVNGFGDDRIYIQVTMRSGAKFFKVIVGEFDRALDTADLKERIRQKTGKTCFTTSHLK